MYIPIDNVNHEALIKEDDLADERGIVAHAFEKHLIPVSPNCFYACLQAMALDLILCVPSSNPLSVQPLILKCSCKAEKLPGINTTCRIIILKDNVLSGTLQDE